MSQPKMTSQKPKPPFERRLRACRGHVLAAQHAVDVEAADLGLGDSALLEIFQQLFGFGHGKGLRTLFGHVSRVLRWVLQIRAAALPSQNGGDLGQRFDIVYVAGKRGHIDPKGLPQSDPSGSPKPTGGLD